MNRLKRLLVVSSVVVPLLISAQPLTEPSTVFLVLSGPDTSALYHRQGCPVLSATGASFMSLKDAKARYFQPHCACIFGHDGAPPCAEAASRTTSPTTVPGVVPAAEGVGVRPTPTSITTAPRAGLLGATEAQVMSRVGAPSLTQGGLWYYDRPNGTAKVAFKSGIVSDVQPADFGVATSAPQVSSTGSSTHSYTNVDGKRVQSPTKASTAPPGATARCGDGTYSFSANRRGTCSHHGGVAEWLK